jgi:aryl-alcohol dehydrogenase-like predicted oxidoreductase
MMARWHENLFPILEELNIGFVAFSPLANGILSDAFSKGEKFEKEDYRSVMPQYSDEAFEKNRELFNLIRSIAKEKEATPAQISLAWILNKKPYIVPIPGSRKIERIKENFMSSEINLSENEIKQIDNRLNSIEMSGVFGGSAIKSK